MEAAYHIAFNELLQVVSRLLRRGLNDIHLYMFSEFNLKQKDSEIISCLKVENVFVNNLIKKNIQLKVHGNYKSLNFYNKDFVSLLQILQTKPYEMGAPTVHLYVCYSFAGHIDELRSTYPIELVLDHLIHEKIDMVVRTGGAHTLSDFLPTALRYSQLVFLDALFNDVGVDDYMQLCDDYDRNEINLKYGF